METRTPNLYFVLALLVNLMRASAFDQLNGFLQGCLAAGRQKQVQMIGHHYKFVKQACTAFAILQHALDQDVRVFFYLEDRTVLPRLRCNEVDASWRSSVRQSPQALSSGAKAP
jgi:hypothetical protein